MGINLPHKQPCGRTLIRQQHRRAQFSDRYVGVALPEMDEDFDFEQTLRDIHVELADLNSA